MQQKNRFSGGYASLRHAYSQIKVSFDLNYSTSRYNKNLEKIIHIKDVKNIDFV